ncbi:Ubiquitin fusion degradation protein [Phytophthora palmivora]|uniref:Ubiquitin fusion degradation protein n=1 Tax=Phytophthora palmivora TaxID=4796 RepID=A0A2P4XSM0_9STRA|nr:Ubiquitin fusion degradation protein [Phytophthora palmivora]
MPHLEFGDKIVLPPKILLELQCMKIPTPLLFMVRDASLNTQLKENNTDEYSYQYCCVQEFSAPDGQVFLPYWLMQNLHVPEGGSVVVTSAVNLPRGVYCRLQPESMSFLDLAAEIGPKLLMETALRRYSVLSVNSTIVIEYGDVRYYVRVAELKPASVVSLCGNVDLEMDFMPPEFECLICHERVLQVNESRHQHCPNCTIICDSSEALAEHQRDEHTASCQCTLCGGLFTRVILAQGRMRRKGDTSALLISKQVLNSISNNRKPRKPKRRPNPQLQALPQRTSKSVATPEDSRAMELRDHCISNADGTSHRTVPAPSRTRTNTQARRRSTAKFPPRGRLDKLP